MMFFCKDCENYFSDDDIETECIFGGDEIDAPDYQDFCPHCHGVRYIEASECALCGEGIPKGKHLCKYCADEIKAYHDEMILKIADDKHITFTEAYNAFTEWLENECV